jgi:hypothetical protein
MSSSRYAGIPSSGERGGDPMGALCDGVAQMRHPVCIGGWGRGSPDEEFADHLDDRTGVAFCAGAVWPQPAATVR